MTLGFFVVEDCAEFDATWKKMDRDPLLVHRAIWYQFMYHVDRDIQIPEKLNAWAMNVSQPYLECYDETSLEIDTSVKWKDLQFDSFMDTDDTSAAWIPVSSRKGARAKSPPAGPQLHEKQATSSHRPPRMMHELPHQNPNL